MLKSSFNALPIIEKLHLVLEQGVDVGSRVHYYYQVKLFWMPGFFVEVYYRQLGKQVDKLELMDIDEALIAYYPNIDISEATSLLE